MYKKIIKLLLCIFISVSILTACSTNTKKDFNDISKKSDTKSKEYIEILDAKGSQKIPKNAKSIVVLDSRAFKTLADWGIKPAVAPKPVMPKTNPIVSDKAVTDIGNHKEPNLELIAASNPEIIIVGQRFGKFYDELKKLTPTAVVLDLNINIEGDKPGENLIKGLKHNTEILGKVYGKENEAKKLIENFDNELNKVMSLKLDDKKFMGLIVTGGNISYSAPKNGRVWGPVFDLLKLNPSLEIKNSSSDHKGDDISVESIAQSNPDVMLVLDRDAALANSKSLPATDVIKGSKALKDTNAVKNNKVFFAPLDTYTNESIQTFTELFKSFSEFMK